MGRLHRYSQVVIGMNHLFLARGARCAVGTKYFFKRLEACGRNQLPVRRGARDKEVSLQLTRRSVSKVASSIKEKLTKVEKQI